MNHLPVLPILIPLFAASIVLFFEHRRFGMVPQRIVAWTSIAAMLGVACMLVAPAASGEVSVYLLGDWPARLGIVLMVDRLSALMLLEAVPPGPHTFWIWTLVLGTSFMMLVGLARAGTRLFWRVEPWPDAGQHTLEAYTPAHEAVHAPSRPLETAAIVLLLAYGLVLVLAAAPVLDYTRATAAQLQVPADYVDHMRAATPTLREP